MPIGDVFFCLLSVENRGLFRAIWLLKERKSRVPSRQLGSGMWGAGSLDDVLDAVA